MSQFPPDLPARLSPLAPKLRHYQQRLAEAAPGLATACYLTGSLALNAFDERRSDIDFVAVLARPATPGDLATLAARRFHSIANDCSGQWRREHLSPTSLMSARDARV